MGVSFSVPKTELIHWRTQKDRDPPSRLPVCLNGTLFHPSASLRWLGYWFTPSLETTTHFMKRLSRAQGAFALVKRLAPPGMGLSPYMCRRLAAGLIFPILSYGADLFVPTKATLDKLSVFWNKVLRWVTNCFSSTIVTVLPCEACLPPLQSLLPYKRKMAALRLACSCPSMNPAAARLPPSFPNQGSRSIREASRLPLRGLRNNYTPLKWDQYRPVRSPRRHPPIDAICHSILNLANTTGSFPMMAPHLLPDYIPHPQADTLDYRALKAQVRSQLLQDWKLLCPPHPSYAYEPSLRPHPFMGLDRFTAGRLHQMRSGKSYLAAHTSWDDRDSPKTCPYCEEADETFEHAILHCTSKLDARELHLPGADDVGIGSPLWGSRTEVLGLARYIQATGTGFPPTTPAARLGSATPSVLGPA